METSADAIPAVDLSATSVPASHAGATVAGAHIRTTPQPLPLENGGRVAPVRGDRSLQTASVLETLQTGRHPERVSPLLPPKPFDRAAFESNPSAYLDEIEPGRVFQTAQPSRETPELRPTTPAMVRIARNGETLLSVRGAPSAPVTFTAFDMGTFKENRLNSITVQADAKGTASVTFVGSAGAINDCNILAGSPLASGQARFTVTIEAKAVAVQQK